MKQIFWLFLLSGFLFAGCESETEKKARLAQEEKVRIERQLEKRRIERQERKERVVYEMYINNSLSTGSTPYAYCFGSNKSCSSYKCSHIQVTTPYNSDVIVVIKKNTKVIRHAYIKANSTYTFELPNGICQTFFYFGKGWNPNKVMKQTTCGILKGGFVSAEYVSKDSPVTIENDILSYELIIQSSGNFNPQSSSIDEAF